MTLFKFVYVLWHILCFAATGYVAVKGIRDAGWSPLWSLFLGGASGASFILVFRY